MFATTGCGGDDPAPGHGGSGGTGGVGGTGGTGGTGGATPEEICGNGTDDDGDGDADCADRDCADDEACRCGNGVLDDEESCDGENLNGQTCVTLGYASGTLGCTQTCDFNVSECVPADEICDNGVDDDKDGQADCDDEDCASTWICLCGNGVRDTGENCDGDDLGGETCLTLDFDAGELRCKPDCYFDISDCRLVEDCADGVDDDGDGDADCQDTECQDAANCNVCGDNRADPKEVCDGTDLAGETCLTKGFIGGTLLCTGCAFDTSECLEPEVCTGGLDEDGDGAIDCDDTDCANDANCTPGAFCHTALPVTGAFSGTTAGGSARFAGTCSTAGMEKVHVFTPGQAGEVGNLHVELTSTGNLALHVRTVCEDLESELACVDQNPGNVTETLDQMVVGGQPVYLFVDAASTLLGYAYDLTVSFDRCGNGTVSGYEECDPPNGTTCAENCLWAEDDCTDLVDNDRDGLIDCQDPSSCGGVDGVCTPGTGAVGTACSLPSDCASAAGADPICWSEAGAGFPSGMCSEACSLTSPDCGPGAACLDVGRTNGTGACYQTCTTATNCQPGYRCGIPTGGSASVCLPGCTADAQCPLTGHCDRPSGLCTVAEVCDNAFDDDHDGKVDCWDIDCASNPACLPPELDCTNLLDDDGDGEIDCRDATRCKGIGNACTPGTGAVGSPCTATNQCASTVGDDPACIDRWVGVFPTGYCTELCDFGANDCPTGTECVDRGIPLGQSVPPASVGVCMKTCTVPEDCGAGWTCGSPAPSAPMLCVPVENCSNVLDDDLDGLTDCADPDCAAAPACQAPTCAGAITAQAVNTGTTVGGTSNYQSSYCGDGTQSAGAGASEVVYQYSPNLSGPSGTLLITLQSATDQGIHVRTDCALATSEVACADFFYGGTNEQILLQGVPGNATFFVIVDPFEAGEEGPFTLTFDYQVCGDNTVGAIEDCDDGNTVDGDSCNSVCTTYDEREWNDVVAMANPYVPGFSGAINPDYDLDFIAITVPGPSSTLSVEVGDGGTDGCLWGEIDSELFIVDAALNTLAYNDDIDYYDNWCSYAVATGLSAGTYYAAVRANTYYGSAFEYELSVGIQ